MKRSAFLWGVLSLFVLESCSLQKRHYRPGYYLAHSQKRTDHKTYSTQEHLLLNYIRLSPLQTESIALKSERANIKEVEKTKFTHSKKTFVQLLTPIVTTITPILPKQLKAFYVARMNHVPKAGFRMMVFGLFVFGSAVLLFVLFPDLVYVSIGLLAIALVFSFVSIVTSVNARKDHINNSPFWLIMALIAIILDILIICGISLFLISLF